MLFISIPLFIVFVCISAGTVCAAGIFSYILLMRYGYKSPAETVFFWALVAFVLLIVVLFYIVIYSRRRVRGMEKIVELVRFNGVLAEDRFSEFGSLGTSLRLLYHEILEVSERRADRIYLLNNMTETLLGFVDEAMLVTDVAGKVLLASPKYIAKYGEQSLNIVGSMITKLYPGLDFKSVFLQAEQTHGSIEYKIADASAVFYPVHGKQNTIDAMCVSFDKNFAFSIPQIKKDAAAVSGKRKGGKGLFEFFRRGRIAPKPDEK